jgi:Phytanoyl-CoA dioxygenase (PhyH)
MISMVLRIAPSDPERKAGIFSQATLDKAALCMRTEGALLLEDIVDPKLIVEARENFLQKYARYLDGGIPDAAAVEVGDRRLMITVDLAPPFDRRELIANSWLFSVLDAAFQGEFVLDAYGIVCSMPTAARQHIHQDGADLFPQSGLNRLLPLVAVTVAIPLLEMNETNGTTSLFPGSHHDETVSAAALEPGSAASGEEPLVREGSCLLWDYRLRHGGTPNRSASPRPLLYMTYCRPWFTDHKNYQKHPALRASERFFEEAPHDLRNLLARAQRC